MKTILYAGSFDPLTNGHLWMIEQGASLADKIIVAIGENPDKHYTFSLDERRAMLEACLQHIPNAEVALFKNRYLIDYAREIGARFMLRGIRNLADYEFERSMRHINNDLCQNITTLFLMPPRDKSEISSSFVKGLIGPDGWHEVVCNYVPQAVFQQICAKFCK